MKTSLVYSSLISLLAAVAQAQNVNSYQSIVLSDGPLAFYALSPGSDPAGVSPDLTGNGNDGVDSGITVATGPTAYITNAANFNGSADVDLSEGTDSGLLDFSGPITLEAWVQPASSTEGLADILAKGYDGSQNDDELTLRANGGDYFGGSYGSRGSQGASGGQQTTNWTYLACTYDGTNWNMYVNTTLVQSNPDSAGAINFVDDWMIGNGSASGNGRYFNGNISEVALYDYGLTPAQVLNHYYYGEIDASPTNSPPIITAQPQSQVTYLGGSVTLRVSDVSAFPTTNQWLKGGAPISGQTNSTFTLANVQAGDVTNYSVIVGNGQGTTNSALAAISLINPAQLEWSGIANNGVWDTDVSANWINLSNSQQTVFNPGDQVLFNDTAGAPTNVTISNSVSPSLITVDSSTNNYTFGGTGSISGTGALVKEGPSTLTIVSPASFTGSVSISGGTIYAGDNSFASVSAITITNNSTLDFGGGSYNHDQPVLVSGTGVNGEGALYNSYSDYPGEALDITLAGDTTFGGSSRWDLTGGFISGPHNVTINWASGGYGEWNSAVLASNVGNVEIATGTLGIKSMGANFGNPASTFIVDSGAALDFWTGDAGYAKNFHVLSNGLLQILAGFTSFNGSVTFENASEFVGIYGSGNQSLNGAFTLNGVVHFVFGDGNFIFTNVISGVGGFVWDAYNHEIILEASNTYSGPTVIGNGLTLALSGNGSISDSALIFFGGLNPYNNSLDVSARVDETLTLASGQTLAGIGSVNGSLVVSPGAVLSPSGTNVTLGMTEGANSSGAISAYNNITLNGTTVLKLDGSGVNDSVQSYAGITYGGTLDLVNISGVPSAVGDSFQIFNAASYAGSFASIVPPTPGPGLAWDTSQLNSGIINVITAPAQPAINSVVKSGGNLIFSGTNGAAGGTYYVLTTTNLAVPLTNWVALATNSFASDGSFSVTNAITPGTPARFYVIEQAP